MGPSSPKLNIKSNLERKRTQTFTDWCCQSATKGKRYANTKQKYCQTIWNERKPGRFLVLLWIHHATAHSGNNLSALQFSFCGGEIARLRGYFPQIRAMNGPLLQITFIPNSQAMQLEMILQWKLHPFVICYCQCKFQSIEKFTLFCLLSHC